MTNLVHLLITALQTTERESVLEISQGTGVFNFFNLMSLPAFPQSVFVVLMQYNASLTLFLFSF